RKLGISSINMDLIYGLPHQTPASYRKTCDQILTLQPERISLFNYAHLPHRFKTQRQINEENLPSSEEKLDILCETSNTLIQSGYTYIGMDHFAKHTDELAIAQREGSLQRNFQGYSTAREADLVAMGVSSISHIGNTYSQNFKTLQAYSQALKEKKLPIERGYQLTDDDLIRQDIINQLTCHNGIDIKSIENKYKIVFTRYFSTEADRLIQLQDEGLITIHPSNIQVTDAGRLVVRRVCMAFDIYIRAKQNTQTTYSRII
ncbi:MAG: oxygen-independent coproporphyrinogen III oxidase, partial [Gammaproteobacteria bacterium]|nr:oxygen-independent coproporphyrinogen III oxidase [Gammaproteobacteria bacterium]